MNPAIAIVGMACRYPDAESPAALWENALAQRRAFRRMPDVRLNMADYFSADRHAADRTYSLTAALIEDYEFDRVRYRVSGVAYRSADLAHWLALDIAAQALADAGFPQGDGLPRAGTGVYLGNTLTGEFSRAATMRLRWPYVRRILSAALSEEGRGAAEIEALLRKLEGVYKRPFAEVGEETLAGGLSNTIAGRICNHFDLKGGGYTVDGACASSLLATATACSALAAGDCDVAIAGGVDLSLDPFELIGFAKAGALAAERMRVFDVRSGGFWPGEGCGFTVLQRVEDALAQGRRIYALIRGWGISSDGSGGITRPEVEGQLLALQRAYRRAGFGPDSVGYFEGHGTGTAVGDATELRTLVRARRDAGAAVPAAISSIKANIGHTKAAAGVAGLIKAAMAVHAQVRPPATGCESPHPEMGAELCALRVPQLWPESLPVRSAVSAMGFGGINSHVVLESAGAPRRAGLSPREVQLGRSPQDAELFLFASEEQIAEVAGIAAEISWSEMTDLAASVANSPRNSGAAVRRAVVASTPAELSREIAATPAARPDRAPRIGFLFPGQGSQNSAPDTEIAQPSVVRDSIAALKELRAAGIEAQTAIGHSLGEITALYWAGVIDEDAALRIASVRGRLMAGLNGQRGAMAGIAAGEDQTRSWIEGEPVVVAGLNSPCQTVISGEANAVARVARRAQSEGARAVLLPVSHAFHSPLVEPMAEPFYQHLLLEQFAPPRRPMVSTITGAALSADDDVRALLRRQIASPVRFRLALDAAGPVDLWIEVGPGRVLSGFVAGEVVSIESGSGARRPFLKAVAKAWELGAPVRPSALFEGRFSRAFRGRRSFFVNPCELAPATFQAATEEPRTSEEPVESRLHAGLPAPLHVVRDLVAQHAELPPDSFPDNARLLGDLHLNSIVVAQIAGEAAHRLNLSAPAAPLEYAGMTVQEMADTLATAGSTLHPAEPLAPAGVDSWVRAFETRLIPKPLPAPRHEEAAGEWRFFGTPGPFPDLPASGGVLLHFPADIPTILDAARAAVRLRAPARFVVVQHRSGGAALARTLHLENRGLPVCVVDVQEGDPLMSARVAAEAAAVRTYSEAHYDEQGVRRVPVMSPVWESAGDHAIPSGVLVVTGGGKGIGAECAIEAARMGATRLAILGTSPECENPGIDRMRSLGMDVTYFRVDVTDAAAVRAIFEQIRTLGPIAGILHCAGINTPKPVETLTEDDFRRTIAVKVDGLANLLAAASSDPLELVIAFGSIIARIGMPGETDYALANEWMACDLDRWAATHRGVRCLTLEFSVWAGTGMGERVARLDFLRQAGVSPISIDEGVQAFRRVVGSGARGALVVAGRFGAPPTVDFGAPELPLMRFLERPRLHYPGVELIADADLSAANDPYLDDHVFSGARLLPGVLALEAMAQAAMGVTAAAAPPAFERVRFARPVVVPPDASLTIRIAALVRAPGVVEITLRSADTGFQTDHFHALCRFGASPPAAALQLQPESVPPLDPARDLYSGILFQRGRFHRLRAYPRLRATECVAELAPAPAHDWFNRYLPQALVLGDAGVRDAAIHAIQACIPHSAVLPGGAAGIAILPHTGASAYTAQACERRREADLLVYDIEISTPEHGLVERWDGLELRIVSPAAAPAAWPAALLAPYLERRMAELAAPCSVAVTWGANGNGARSHRRPDGVNGLHYARSHAGDLTLMVTASAPAGCDCEPVVARAPETWRDLLGAEGFALASLVAREADESVERAATRVWSALECAKKAGLRQGLGIVLATPEGQSLETPGWVVLTAGTSRIATWIANVREAAAPLAFAILVAS